MALIESRIQRSSESCIRRERELFAEVMKSREVGLRRLGKCGELNGQMTKQFITSSEI